MTDFDLTAKASGAVPVYMYRPVLNAEQIIEWAAAQGFDSTLLADDMHVTVVFSRAAFSVEASRAAQEHGTLSYGNVVVRGGYRKVEPLGAQGAVVLKIESDGLMREHQEYRRMGASWDYESYTPHVTLTYRGGALNLSAMAPFTGDIVLGPLRAKLLSTGKDLPAETPTNRTEKSMTADINKAADILKVDNERRIVWGWASVSTLKGELVTDLQGDRIAPAVMEKMADRFMRSARAAKAMHDGDDVGEVIHSFPLTKELAAAFGLQTDREGWITGTYIKSDSEWAKVQRGDYKGLSIGGRARRKEVME